VHRALWPVLAVVVAVAAVMAFVLRPPPEPQTQAAIENVQ
jgi:hypothetical protein